jgi:hypothetical protein
LLRLASHKRSIAAGQPADLAIFDAVAGATFRA